MMKNKIRKLFIYIILGFLIEGVCEWIESTYLSNLYKTSFFAVLVTMTVFAFTLFSYVSGKMSEWELKYECSFEKTRNELKDAFQILVTLDILFLVLLVLRFSDLSESKTATFVIMGALNTLFICVVHILIDLGKSIFTMFEAVGNIPKDEVDNKNDNNRI